MSAEQGREEREQAKQDLVRTFPWPVEPGCWLPLLGVVVLERPKERAKKKRLPTKNGMLFFGAKGQRGRLQGPYEDGGAESRLAQNTHGRVGKD